MAFKFSNSYYVLSNILKDPIEHINTNNPNLKISSAFSIVSDFWGLLSKEPFAHKFGVFKVSYKLIRSLIFPNYILAKKLFT